VAFLVDTSIVIRLLAARKGDDLLRQRLSRTVHAPHLIDAEVASVVRGLTLTSKTGTRITPVRAREMLDDYGSMRIVRHPVKPVLERVFELRENFTSYDAVYVALAEALELPLLTDDKKFGRASAGVHRAAIQVYPAT
jgi:predicted nucleic acid-binding protein